MKWVYNAVTMGNPENYKFDFCLWTLKLLRALIYKERSIKRSQSAVSRLLGHLGLRPQRPIVKNRGGHFGRKVIRAVSPRGDRRFSFIEDRMHSKKFINFLKKLHRDAGVPIWVIRENAP